MTGKDYYYGRPILSPGLININNRIKNRMITRVQYRLLNLFGKLNTRQTIGSAYARMARRLIGSYLYSIKLEINSSCNLHCRMCYVPKDNNELEFSLIEKLIRQVRNSGTRLEIMGGEPLLRKELPAIIKLAKDAGKIPFVSLYTNGNHATPEICAMLKSSGLDAAIVTLISAMPSVHDKFTGVNGSWEKTIAGIRNFRAAGINTYTFTAIHRENKFEISQINNFVQQELEAEPLFYQYIPQRKDDPLMISNEEWYALKNMVLSAHPDHAAFVRDFDMLTGNACSGGNFVYTVKVDGSVQPCPFMSDMPLGNIREDNFWTIVANRYRNTRLIELKCLPETCKSCTYASVCGGGCRAANQKLPGSYTCADFRCQGPYHEPLLTGNVMERLPCFF